MQHAAGAKFRGITRERRPRAIFAKEITEVHLSDLSDGAVPGEHPTILFMASNEKQTAMVNGTIRLETISFNQSHYPDKIFSNR